MYKKGGNVSQIRMQYDGEFNCQLFWIQALAEHYLLDTLE